jgi:hypothetical protein
MSFDLNADLNACLRCGAQLTTIPDAPRLQAVPQGRAAGPRRNLVPLRRKFTSDLRRCSTQSDRTNEEDDKCS